MLFITVKVLLDDKSSKYNLGVIVVLAATAPAKGIEIFLIVNFSPKLNIHLIFEAKVAVVEYESICCHVPSVEAIIILGVTFEDCWTYFRAVTLGVVPAPEPLATL